MRIWLALALIFTLALCKAEITHWPQLTKQAYTYTWQYNLAAAENALAQDKKAGLAHIYVADKKWFIELFATENATRYNTYKQGKENALKQIEAGATNLPFYFFAKGEFYLHSAILKLKFGEYSSAAWEINKAYKILKEGNSKYPDFLLLKRDLYLLQALVGTVPENYSWMLKILGFEGDLKSSMAKYAEVAKGIKNHPEYKIFLPETQLIQAFLTHHLLNNPDAAWKIMNEATDDFAANPISAFARANLGLHQKKNEEVLQTLLAYKTELPAIPHLDYYQGLAKLQRGDGDAGHYLARYLKHFKGLNYIKDAYLKLGWAFLLNGDTKNYFNSLELAKHYGKSILEEDRSALREAKKAGLPQINLLKARLLFDGGYYQQALVQIRNTKPYNLTQTQQAEYYYRTARIQEYLELYNNALENYGTVIEKFSSLQEYFAPASCLYSGMIWEKQKNPEKAKYFYRKCQSYKNYIYKDSFDQKALAGLKRLN
ncbi:MAG: hypothetical protein ACXWDO_03570 [Bacteroidia bacterium]